MGAQDGAEKEKPAGISCWLSDVKSNFEV